MTQQTIGSKLLALKARSGLSLPKIAKSGGYKNASSVQRYFDDAYDPASLPGPVATRLIQALVGFGDPPIQRDDIIILTDVGFVLERKFSPEGAVINSRRAKAPLIYCGTSYRTPADEADGAPSIEAMTIDQDDPIRVFKKPPHMLYRSIEATFVSSRTMAPRFNVGEIIFFELERPAAAGQDVVIYLQSEDDRPLVVLCRLLGEIDEGIEIEILNPKQRLVLPLRAVAIVAPILSFNEMLEGANLTE